MYVNEIKARQFVLATCGVSAGRAISNFDNRVEFELPPGTDIPEAIDKTKESLPLHTSKGVGVGETLHLFDLGYGRSFFIKQTDKGATAGMQQIFTASRNLLDAMGAVWQAIAEEGLDVGSNAEAVELILDADRLETMGGSSGYGKAAAEELDALTEIYGQPKVDKELAKLVNFV